MIDSSVILMHTAADDMFGGPHHFEYLQRRKQFPHFVIPN